MPADMLPRSADLQPFLPELALVAAILAVLLIPIFSPRKNILAVSVAAASGLFLAFLGSFLTHHIAVAEPQAYLGGLLLLDPFAWAIKLLLILFTMIVMALWFTDSHDKFLTRGQAGDAAEFFVLLLSATLGLCLMASTTNLLMMFLAIELASLPSYVLAGFRKTHRLGAEAAMKYVLFGAASAAIMLYGMSLLYGLFGTLDIQTMGDRLALPHAAFTGTTGVVLAMGLLGLLTGVGFKIAMVPVHFWCPDVFEGANIDITTFLSVASKAAGLGLLMRLLFTLTHGLASGMNSSVPSPAAWLAGAVLVLGVITCFWGNLAAYPQTNIKRLLAWSSVAHAGYMLIGMSAVLTARTAGAPNAGTELLLFYLFMYLFMNGGAFVAAAAIAQRLTGPNDAGMSLGVERMIPSLSPAPTSDTGTGEDLAQYTGLSRRAPILAATMLLFMLSLTGIPLTIGFATKIKLFSTLFNLGGLLGWIGVIAVGVNTVIAAFYYFRVIRQMYLRDSDAPRLIELAPVTMLAMALVVPNIFFFIAYGWVDREAAAHATMFITPAHTDLPPAESAATP